MLHVLLRFQFSSGASLLICRAQRFWFIFTEVSSACVTDNASASRWLLWSFRWVSVSAACSSKSCLSTRLIHTLGLLCQCSVVLFVAVHYSVEVKVEGYLSCDSSGYVVLLLWKFYVLLGCVIVERDNWGCGYGRELGYGCWRKLTEVHEFVASHSVAHLFYCCHLSVVKNCLHVVIGNLKFKESSLLA